MDVHECIWAHTIVHTWRPEDSVPESILSCHHAGSGIELGYQPWQQVLLPNAYTNNIYKYLLPAGTILFLMALLPGKPWLPSEFLVLLARENRNRFGRKHEDNFFLCRIWEKFQGTPDFILSSFWEKGMVQGKEIATPLWRKQVCLMMEAGKQLDDWMGH